jgi:hypothetical protein
MTGKPHCWDLTYREEGVLTRGGGRTNTSRPKGGVAID